MRAYELWVVTFICSKRMGTVGSFTSHREEGEAVA